AVAAEQLLVAGHRAVLDRIEEAARMRSHVDLRMTSRLQAGRSGDPPLESLAMTGVIGAGGPAPLPGEVAVIEQDVVPGGGMDAEAVGRSKALEMAGEAAHRLAGARELEAVAGLAVGQTTTCLLGVGQHPAGGMRLVEIGGAGVTVGAAAG